jgi:hypothetical protein
MEQQALATFVVSADRQSAPTEVDATGHAPPQELPFAILLASVFTLFTFAVNGYHPYAEDGGLYLAGVKRLLDPALYPHSTAFVMEPARFSLFAPMVAAIVTLSHLSAPVALLALHLASIWATLFAAWMLASRCWTPRTARTGAVVLLACWLALPVAGTALVLMDPYLTARSISTPCMVLALVGVLDCTGRNWPATKNSRKRGLCLWIASILLAAATHPLMASYALGATLMLACQRSSNPRTKRWAIPALSATALAIAACLQLAAKPENAVYRRIALTRTYWFPAAWSWYELIGLAAPLVIFAFVAWKDSRMPRLDLVRVDPARRALAQTALATGATAWMVAMLFARTGAPTHLVARMQPLRAFHIVYLLMVLFLGAKLGESILKHRAWRWVTALLLLGGVMFAAERNAFLNSQHIESPWTAPRNLWVQAFLWIRENTPGDALFALDADYINAPGEDAQCFRAIAERSSLPDYSKDGGEASIAPELTAQWQIGQQAQQGLSAPATTDSMRIAALNPQGVSWLVLDDHAVTNFNCPYANAAVKVCRLR